MARRLFAALDDLLAIAPPARRPPLERQRELLSAAVDDAYSDRREVETARIPDMQGIGSGADVAAPAGKGAAGGSRPAVDAPRVPV